MRTWIAVGAAALLGCSSDLSVKDGGPDASADDAAPDGGAIEGGGGGDSGADGGTQPKPRLYVSGYPIGNAIGALFGYVDPDSINANRPPDIQVSTPSPADDVVSAKNKRVFVAGETAVYVFDDPLRITSQTMPQTMTKSSFLGLQMGDDLQVTTLAYQDATDILATADPNRGGVQVFKNASTTQTSTPAVAKLGGANDLLHYVDIAANGTIAGSSVSGSQTAFWQNGVGATGALPKSTFVIGAGRIVFGATRLYVPTADFGVGGAAVYVYDLPLTMTMQSWAFELKIGSGATTTSANSVALDAQWAAVSYSRQNNMSDAICVYDSPAALGPSSVCKNTIELGSGLIVTRLWQHKGTLYAGVGSSNMESRIDVYRSPLMDKAPTVSLKLPNSIFASGFAWVE